jgi:hypothetical protein
VVTHNGVVTLRRFVACLTIAAVLCSLGHGLTVAAHVVWDPAHDHHDQHSDHERELEAMLHGHAHHEQTPQHEHGLAVFAQDPSLSGPSKTVRMMPAPSSIASASAPAPQTLSRLAASVEAHGAGPPAAVLRSPILRI